MRAISMLCLAGAVGLTTAAAQYAYSQSPYVPAAVFCADGGTAPCSIIPAYIGPDPDLDHSIGYTAIVGGLPTSSETDPQTPFDNMSWQSFVGLNWIAGTESAPAEKGLAATGLRVWQTWAKVNRVFGNAPVQAACANPSNLPVISIGSDGGGNPSQKNDDYYQASTNVPLIDINGNWTLFERRLNVTEIAYLAAPGGNPFNTLLTVTGQNNFVAAGDSVAFTASSTDPRGTRGAMELKIAWRLLGTDDDAGRYITQKVLLTVAPDLVIGTQPICATVTVGMVGMHIIQRNPDYATNIALEPEWIWSTFEHVDNAPLAETACDLTNPQACTTLNKPSCGGAASGAAAGSYFVPLASPVAVATNVPPTPSTTGPAFVWNPIQPYAKDYTQPVSVNGRTFYLGPQVVRCWQVYTLTDRAQRPVAGRAGDDGVAAGPLQARRNPMGSDRRRRGAATLSQRRCAGPALQHDAGDLHPEQHRADGVGRTGLLRRLPSRGDAGGRHNAVRLQLPSRSGVALAGAAGVREIGRALPRRRRPGACRRRAFSMFDLALRPNRLLAV
ncbi:hypothetical protein ACFSKM_20125 [Ancylobacter dichloromethanicus]